MSKLEQMFSNGWYPILREHLHSESFREIGKSLLKFSNEKIEITPKFPDTFRAFKECPYSKLNTLIIGTSPYHGKLSTGAYLADGIAYSCRDSEICPKPLNYILSHIDECIYKGEGYNLTNSFDLKKWSNQGVLLLNVALSIPINPRLVNHNKLWNPFITYVIQELSARKDNLGVILMGESAKSFKGLMKNDTWGIYTCEDPVLAYLNGEKWKHENVFKSLYSYHKFLNNSEINWNI